MKLKTLVESGDPELLATGFQFTEGPVWHPDGFLLFSDIPANRVHRWTPTGLVDVWRKPSGNSNGLTLDRENRLVACEHGNRRVSLGGAGGAVASLADTYEGKRLNSPNDLVVKSDGTVYFTDPPYGITPSESSPYSKVQEQPCNGLYRILTDGTVELLADDFDRPNGLAFSPGESILYVDDSPPPARARLRRSRRRLLDQRPHLCRNGPPPARLTRRHENRRRWQPLRGRRDRRLGIRARRRLSRRRRHPRTSCQLRLGRRRPQEPLHYCPHLALPHSHQGAGPSHGSGCVKRPSNDADCIVSLRTSDRESNCGDQCPASQQPPR